MSVQDLIFAIASDVAGVGLLYASWMHRLGPRTLVIAAGWTVLLLSAVFWVRFGGAEFGISWATAAVAITAWGFVALGREQRRAEERRRQPRTAGGGPGGRAAGRTVARILVAAPMAGVASILLSMALITALPVDTGNQYVLVLLGAPVVWGALAVWIGTTSRLLAAAGLLAGVSATCALLLFV